MEKTYVTEAIVLRRRDFREHDKSIVFYTKKFGKMELIARGTKKITSKLNSHLEPLYQVTLMGAKGKRGDKLAGSLLQEPFSSLRSSVLGIALGQYMSDVVDRLVTNTQPDPQLYDLILEALHMLERQPDITYRTGLLSAHGFVLKLLDHIGYRPEVYRCISCYKGMLLPKNRFHILSGGIICESCAPISLIEPYMNISDEGISTLRTLLDEPLALISSATISDRAWQEVTTLAHKLVVTHTAYELPSFSFLRSISQA